MNRPRMQPEPDELAQRYDPVLAHRKPRDRRIDGGPLTLRPVFGRFVRHPWQGRAGGGFAP